MFLVGSVRIIRRDYYSRKEGGCDDRRIDGDEGLERRGCGSWW